MKIFKAVNLNGKYTNNTDKYQLLIHFNLSTTNISLLDENGIAIETYNNLMFYPYNIQYPQITGQENLSTGAISYNSFNANMSIGNSLLKNSLQKILIPPNYSVSGISAGLFIELDNLDELKGLL